MFVIFFPDEQAAVAASNAEAKRNRPDATTEQWWPVAQIDGQVVCVVPEGTDGSVETSETPLPLGPDGTLAQERATVVARIKAERDRRAQQGGFPAAGKWFHSDTFSRSQQIGLVILGQNIPPALMWKTMDGSFIEMTPTLAQQIFASAANQDAATFKRAEELQFFANTEPNPGGLVLNGWPPIFGE